MKKPDYPKLVTRKISDVPRVEYVQYTKEAFRMFARQIDPSFSDRKFESDWHIFQKELYVMKKEQDFVKSSARTDYERG